MKTIICIFATAVLVLTTTAYSRTWRVNTAGTGDAPTLHAAMDSAVAGDIVLLEAGEYSMDESLFVPPGVQLVGEWGAASTILYVVDSHDLPPNVVSMGGGARLSGLHVRGNPIKILYSHGNNVVEYCIVESQSGLRVVEGPLTNTVLSNCLFIGGSFNIAAYFQYCIIYSELGTGAVGSTVFSCDVLGAVNPAIDVSATSFNFLLDPQFCGIPGSGNYFLQSTSPCLGANNPYGPFPWDIGPLGVGCGTVRVEERTWGGVKALYRNP